MEKTLLFQWVQLIGLHQAKEMTKEVAQTTKTELRTVHWIIKTWKDSGEPSSSRKMWSEKKILNNQDQRSLKCFV